MIILQENYIFLEMKNISKSFNQTKVLDGVDLELKKGEVHALVGGNGAGKSTLMKILMGVYKKETGKIILENSEVNINEPDDAFKNGISMIFQEFSIVPTLTVAQNIFLNHEYKNNFNLINDKEMNIKAKEFLEELEIDINPKSKMETLETGQWQMIEIAKAVSQEAKILIMDEPTAALTDEETQNLFKLIRRLKNKNISIIYISHRMDEIYEICDKITVLRNGKYIITSEVSSISMEKLVEEVVGKEMESFFEWEEREIADENDNVLEVKNLSSGSNVKDVSFDLRRGEILGIAGLMGSGRSETVRSIFGIDSKNSGEIIINGKKETIKNPKEAMNLGLALVPEDRKLQGLVTNHSVKENLILSDLEKVSRSGLVKEKEIEMYTKNYIEKLDIKTDSIYKLVKLLSGGNQQKVVLAKWLFRDPQILMLDEPTRGVDIGAKTEIIELVRELANNGKSILFISSELQELLAVCDRIIIMDNGKVKKEINRKDITSKEELEYEIQAK
jgi:ribose transport system ATP-binding protein